MSSISNLGTSEQGSKLPLPRVPLETESTTKYSGSKNTSFKRMYRWKASESEFFKNLINTEPYKTNYQNKKLYNWVELAKKMTAQFPHQRAYTISTVYNYYKSNFLHKKIESINPKDQTKRTDHSMIDEDIKKFIKENYSSYLLLNNNIDRSRFLEAINNRFSNKPISYKTLDSQIHIIKTYGFHSNIDSATTQTNFAPTTHHDIKFTENEKSIISEIKESFFSFYENRSLNLPKLKEFLINMGKTNTEIESTLGKLSIKTIVEEQTKSQLFKDVIEIFGIYINFEEETMDFKSALVELNNKAPNIFNLLTVKEFWMANKDEILEGPKI